MEKDKRRNERSTGRYELIDDDIVRVKLKGSKSQDFKVSITQDKLSVTRADGDLVAEYKSGYKRAK